MDAQLGSLLSSRGRLLAAAGMCVVLALRGCEPRFGGSLRGCGLWMLVASFIPGELAGLLAEWLELLPVAELRLGGANY